LGDNANRASRESALSGYTQYGAESRSETRSPGMESKPRPTAHTRDAALRMVRREHWSRPVWDKLSHDGRTGQWRCWLRVSGVL